MNIEPVLPPAGAGGSAARFLAFFSASPSAAAAVQDGLTPPAVSTVGQASRARARRAIAQNADVSAMLVARPAGLVEGAAVEQLDAQVPQAGVYAAG
jgi:hypothetical protein